jgi:hypothetical protein
MLGCAKPGQAGGQPVQQLEAGQAGGAGNTAIGTNSYLVSCRLRHVIPPSVISGGRMADVLMRAGALHSSQIFSIGTPRPLLFLFL